MCWLIFEDFNNYFITVVDSSDSVQAATSLFKQIEANWRSKVKTNCVFVDFRKAFDAVDHSVLLKKLNHVAVRGISHKLLTSYLIIRFQYVKIEGECSTIKVLKRGVRQGSMLGPLLSLVYICDLGVHENWQSDIIKYADETIMIEKLNTQSEDKYCFIAGQIWITWIVNTRKRSLSFPRKDQETSEHSNGGSWNLL